MNVNPAKCNECGGNTIILDSKQLVNSVYRVRECKQCFATSKTHEITASEWERIIAERQSIKIILNNIAALKELS